MGEKISVIIPVYKVEPYLRQCLDSVVGQTYNNLEIIIIDDGSPDNCGVICDEYAAKDDRIIVIHKENGGLSAARNDGLDRATGEWVAFVDSDDWCELDYYEQLLRAKGDRMPDIFWAGGFIYEAGSRSEKRVDINKVFFSSSPKERPPLVARKLDIGAPWDALYRRGFLEAEELRFDTQDAAYEDVWFNFLAHIRAKEIGGCPFVGYHYRQAPGSITQAYNLRKPEIAYRHLRKCNEYAEQHGADLRIAHALDIHALKLIALSFSSSWFHPANRQSNKEIAAQIREMKTWPYYARAIASRDDSGLSFKRRVLKLALRLPWMWPLKILYTANQRSKGRA